MESAYHTLNLAYGPYRLKAAYQRNMLLAMGATTGLVALVVALGALLLISPAVPASGHSSGDLRPDTLSFHPIPPPTIKRSGPEVRPTPPNPQTVVGNLTPIDDSSLVDVPTAPFRSITGTPIGEPGVGGIGGGDSSSGAISVDDTTDCLPPIDKFVPVEHQPELIFSVEPEYPRWLKEIGVEGEVVIKALVGRTGDVLDAVVFVSSGNKLLDEAALAVAGKYKYQPAVQNGRPVAVWVTYKVVFKLAR